MTDTDAVFSEQIQKAESRSEASKSSIDHAWNWFKYHAEQRMIIVRFYLILAGALGAGYTAVLADHPLLSALIAVVGVIFSGLFWRLDERVRFLIKLGEAAMAGEESALAQKTQNEAIQIIQKASPSPNGFAASYGSIFRIMFLVSAIAFAVASFYATSKTSLFAKAIEQMCRSLT